MNPLMMISLLAQAAEETPDTGGDMLAGYTVIAVILLAYILSLALRFRRLRAEQALLEPSMEDEQDE
jgi:hypothetical protein